MSNSAIGSTVTLGTLGLMVAATVALGASKVAGPSDSTCLAYIEADQRYDEAKQHHREAKKRYQRAVANQGDSADGLEILVVLRADDEWLERAKSQRREEYLNAYKGIRSSNAEVMTQLLNADRWRCCKKFEPNLRVCRVKWL